MPLSRLSLFPKFLVPVILLCGDLGAQSPSLLTLSTTPSLSILGTPVTLSATVSPGSATGRVTFYDGVTVLGTRTLASGEASLSTVLLPAGSRKLSAYYLGDTSIAPSFSNTITATVAAVSGSTFAAGSTFAVWAGPRAIAVGDFNGDGRTDLAVSGAANQGAAGGVSILLGTGGGSFQAPVTYPAGTGTYGVAVGDFNADGKADLVVAIMGAGVNSFGILLGNGDGTFQPMVTYATGAGPYSVAVGDFNRDGNADIVVAAIAGGVNVHLGHGDGTFAPAVEYTTGVAPEHVTVADFDGDGKADLAVANASGDSISVLIGNGDGTFRTAVNYSTIVSGISYSPSFVLAADFNGDGCPDLAVLTLGGITWIMPGNGDGTFQAMSEVAYTNSPASLSAGDLNGDGKLDLAIVNQDGTVATMLGNGNGTFQPSQTYAVGAWPSCVAVGDFTGDGTTDLAVASGTGNTISVLAGISSIFVAVGSPQTTTVSQPFAAPLQVRVLDGNGNGLGGLAVTFTTPQSGAAAVLSTGTAVTNASGIAGVTATANATAGSYTVTARVGSLSASFTLTNQPASLTLIPPAEATLIGTAFQLPLQVVVRDGAGFRMAGVTVNFQAPATGPTAYLSAASAITDSFGIAQVSATANAVPGTYFVLISVPSQSLSSSATLTNQYVPGVTLSTSSTTSLYGAAVNLTVSVLPTSATGLVSFYDGVNLLGTKPLSSGTASLSTILLPAGSRDLKAYYAGDGVNLPARSNAVPHLVSTAAGTGFYAQPSINGGHQPLSLSVADLNGDGQRDLVVVNSLDGNVGIILGNGDGTFRPQVTYSVPLAGTVGVGDFNGDGKPDLIVSRTGSSSFSGNIVTVLPGNGDGTFQAGIDSPVTGQQQPFLAVGDFNGDGKADLVVVNCCNLNNVTVLLGKGDGTFQPGTNYATGNNPESLAVGDFNGDGVADLAVADAYGNTVSVLLGRGDGTFRTAVGFPAGIWPDSITVADFNGDGYADIAVSNLAYNQSGQVHVLLGTGDGLFHPAVVYTFPSNNPIQIASGDFNGDGKADLAVIGTEGSVWIMPGNGDGTFSVGAPYSVGCHAYSLAVGEFDRNGIADIAITGVLSGCGSYGPPPDATGSLTVLLGRTSALSITKIHAGTFAQGQSGATYTVTVRNGLAGGPTNGTVTVTEMVPAGLTLVSMSGSNWSCLGNSCTRSDALNRGTSYPPITVKVNVAANAPSSVTNRVSVNGGGSAGANADDPTSIGTNSSDLALGKAATQSSTASFSIVGAAGAVDGNTDGNYSDGSVTHTNYDPNAWWQLDLGASATVNSIVIWNRTDGGLGYRLNDYWVFVSNTPFTPSDTPSTLQSRAGTWSSHQTVAPNPGTGITVPGYLGRYVRVQLSGTNYLSLAEVQVFGTTASTANLSIGKAATQSSTASFAIVGAGGAADGNTDGNYSDGSVTHTNYDPNAWWQVDLGASATVNSIVIWNRTDGSVSSRLSDYWVFVSDTPFAPFDTPSTLQSRAGTWSSHQTVAPNPSTSITVPGYQGRYVRVQLSGTNYLSLAEVQVFGTMASSANLSIGKAATQSSTASFAMVGAGGAADGNTDGNYYDGSVTHTNYDANAWWQVDLGASATVNSIVIWNRTDNGVGNRLTDYWVFVSDTPFTPSDTPSTLQNRAGIWSSHQTVAPNPSTSTTVPGYQGRYVRVQLSGTNYLSLAEVQVFGTAASSANLSVGKAATQSSTASFSLASSGGAADGNTDGNYYDGSVTHTNSDANAWWQVDLGAPATLNSIVVWNRTDSGVSNRLSDYWVFVSNIPFTASDTPSTLQNRAGTWSSHQTVAPNPSTSITVPGYQGRYVRLQLSGTNYLSLAEVQVFGM